MADANGLPSELDVVIIGAGISGLNAAYRIQTELPDHSYSILEARDSLGGTWDLFRYPGIRSDTDLHSFGFPWRPWDEQRLIADGPAILNYLKKSAAETKIDRNIRYHHKVLSASWSTEDQRWDLTVAVDGETSHIYGGALVVGCGYYDYNHPLTAEIPGLENFEGRVVHPQFWPEDLDYEGKKVVIVGSGATAITLLPSMTDKAAHVTMLQRSPTYILPLDNSGKSWLDWVLPRSLVFKIVRLQLITIPLLAYTFCRWFPRMARKWLRNEAVKRLGEDYPVDEHFKPFYDPWDQRLCFAPDGDFYDSIRSGKASVATGRIEKIGPDSIVLQSGEKLSVDIIITATGLKLGIAGGIKFFVDGGGGDEVNLADKVLWRASWMQDVPNCAFVLGYTNASWTLGADTTAILFCRVLKMLRSRGLTSAVPRAATGSGLMRTRPYFDLKSTYAQQGAKAMPLTADTGPWKPRTNYFWDLWKAKHASIEDGLEFHRGSAVVKGRG
jgi:cation diffusion facilitator CzcD-associated flavoprotein CzcO